MPFIEIFLNVNFILILHLFIKTAILNLYLPSDYQMT